VTDCDQMPEDLIERDRSERQGWQQRFESTPAGRGMLSVIICVTLVAIIAINLPSSDLRRQLLRPGQPYLNALGLDQNWALFAPDPRRVVVGVSARVTFDDGASRIWTFPHDHALLGSYRDYRWRKWAENLIDPANGEALWKSAALWAAARTHRAGHAVIQVQLLERFHTLAAPGVTPASGPHQMRIIYTLRVTAAAKSA
jgi:hypothetical protein